MSTDHAVLLYGSMEASKAPFMTRAHRAFRLTNANWPKIEEDLANNSTARIEKLLDCPNIKSTLIARNLFGRLILTAIRQADIALLKRIGPAEIGLDAIIQDKTLLQWALDPRPWDRRQEREVVALWLIDKGARIDRGRATETPLYQTFSQRQYDIAKRLLARGANPNDCGPTGVSLLRLVLEHKQRDMATSLLEHGADPDDRGTYGASALQIALIKDNNHIAEKMLEYSVDPDVDCIKGRVSGTSTTGEAVEEEIQCSLLHMSIVKCNRHSTRLLLNAIAKYPAERQRRIVNQVCKGYRPSERCFVQETVSPDFLRFTDLYDPKSAQDSTPILSAVKCEAPLHIVQKLLDMGADPGLPDSTRCLPIHYAIANRQVDVACALTAGYQEYEICNSEGSTPLHKSIDEDLRLVATALLDAGANRWTADARGHNCLHLAVIGRNNELVMRLLHEGSDPNTANHNGDTALGIAMRVYLADLRGSIRRCGSIWEASIDRLEAIEALLIHGAQIPVNLHFASFLRRWRDENKIHFARLDCRGSERCFSNQLTRLHIIEQKMVGSSQEIQKAIDDARRMRSEVFMRQLDRERRERYELLFEESKDPWGE